MSENKTIHPSNENEEIKKKASFFWDGNSFFIPDGLELGEEYLKNINEIIKQTDKKIKKLGKNFISLKEEYQNGLLFLIGVRDKKD